MARCDEREHTHTCLYLLVVSSSTWLAPVYKYSTGNDCGENIKIGHEVNLTRCT